VTAMLTIVCFVCSLSEGISCSSGFTAVTDRTGEQRIFGNFEYFVNKKLRNCLLNACNHHSVLTATLNRSSNAVTILDGLVKTEKMHINSFNQLY
jgi:hypothetical protein